MKRKVFIVVENGELALVSNKDISDEMNSAVSSGQLSGDVYHEEVNYDSEDEEVTTSHGHKINCMDIDDKLTAQGIWFLCSDVWVENDADDMELDEDEIDWDEDEVDWGEEEDEVDWGEEEDTDWDDDEYSEDEGEDGELFTDEELSDEGIEMDGNFDKLNI